MRSDKFVMLASTKKMKLRLKSKVRSALIALGFIAPLSLAIGAYYHRVSLRSREAELKIDLRTMRYAIDHCMLDKQQPPQSLQDLVDARYLRSMPVDPMTRKADWVPVIGEVEVSPNQKAVGLYDVHSNSKSYSTW